MCDRSLKMAMCGVLLVCVLRGGPGAMGASPSETLEKAIYTEETVGNVDEAIKLYEQVISEGKAARNASAQALYRLSQCLLKKNKQAESNAALEKLIKDYPEEKQLIAKARKQLPGELKLIPSPWQDHEVLQLNLKLATGLDVGVYFYSVDSAQHEGKAAWRCATRSFVALNGMEGYSTVLAHKESFAPITSRWMHSLLGDVAAVYKPQVVEITDLLKKTSREIAIDGPVFDNEQGAELFRRLPLAVGYKTSLPIVSTLGGGKINLDLEVASKQSVEVPAGKFECFKLVLSVGQTFYVSTDAHRYIVKFEAGGVSAELGRVFLLEPGKPAKFDGPGFTVTLPERWFGYTPKPVKKEDGVEAAILDNDGKATVSVNITEPEPDQQGKSLKERVAASIEAKTKFAKKVFQDFQIRGAGVQERTLAGRPAYSMVGDYTSDGKKMVACTTVVLGEKQDVAFSVSIAADHFAAYKPELDKLVNSVEFK